MKRRKWLLVTSVLCLAFLLTPLFLPDNPPFDFLSNAEISELTVWWASDKPTRTRYWLDTEFGATLDQARAELNDKGFREVFGIYRGKEYSYFVRGTQEYVSLEPPITKKGTYIDIVTPNSPFDHLRDFKFQFLSKHRDGD